MLLELVGEMCGKKREVKVTSGACRDCDAFFRRTAYKLPADVIRDGKMIRFGKELIIRYIDKVIVEDNGGKVVFKAEIEVCVLWGGLRLSLSLYKVLMSYPPMSEIPYKIRQNSVMK